MKKLGPAKLPNLSFPTSSKDVFTVLHYAGMVTYNPISFMEKNVESLNNDLVSVMLSSSHALLQRLFYDLSESQGSGTSSAKAGGGRARSGSEAAVKSGSTAGKQSIAFKFQAQLTSLMTMLKATESHFVRCVKSNSKCRPLLYEPQLVQKQLLYSGVFEGMFQ
jgi:myosin heavy subunit